MPAVRSVVRTVQLAGYFLRFGCELFLTQPKTREARADWLHRFCRTALDGFGVELTVIGPVPVRGVIISNHLSYVDIVVYAALVPCVFCAKAEIEGWPVIGWMTRMAGTVFVDRGRGGSALRARSGMEAAAAAGLPVVFFPEGTTSNGSGLLPFRSGLLSQAMAAEQPITAAHLRYTLDKNNGPGISAAENICWGDVLLPGHAFRFLGLRGVHATVSFADGSIVFSARDLHRKAAAAEAEDAVRRLAEATAPQD